VGLLHEFCGYLIRHLSSPARGGEGREGYEGREHPMTPEELRPHIELASVHRGYRARQLTARIVTVCWPGGPADRIEPSALDWLRLWRPQRSDPPLPACSCASGHCQLCN
jgi:hypothetical protein